MFTSPRTYSSVPTAYSPVCRARVTSRYGIDIINLSLTFPSTFICACIRTDLYSYAQISNDNEDNAPFQIDPLGVQAKQLHRVPVPPVDENLFSGTNSETLPSFTQDLSEVTLVGEESIFDFSDVPLAFDESAFESLDVTFAQKNHCLRDPDQAEEESRSSIHLLFEK